jgi:hypothetical protein
MWKYARKKDALALGSAQDKGLPQLGSHLFVTTCKKGVEI